MKSACVCFFLIFYITINGNAQKLPDGYILQYGQNFTAGKSIGDFWYTHPLEWSLAKGQNNSFLHVRNVIVPDSLKTILPANRCILKNSIYGDFILEVDVYPHASKPTSEICFFLGLKDSTRYYFVLLSTSNTDDRQGIYLVKNSICTKLPERISTGRILLPDTWQKIRLERNITRRTILVFAGEMSQPVLEIQNYELVMGRIGFGSINSAASFDNLSVWAPTVIPEESDE